MEPIALYLNISVFWSLVSAHVAKSTIQNDFNVYLCGRSLHKLERQGERALLKIVLNLFYSVITVQIEIYFKPSKLLHIILSED